MNKYLFLAIGMTAMVFALWNMLGPTGIDALGSGSTFGTGVIYLVIAIVFLYSSYQSVSKKKKR